MRATSVVDIPPPVPGQDVADYLGGVARSSKGGLVLILDNLEEVLRARARAEPRAPTPPRSPSWRCGSSRRRRARGSSCRSTTPRSRASTRSPARSAGRREARHAGGDDAGAARARRPSPTSSNAAPCSRGRRSRAASRRRSRPISSRAVPAARSTCSWPPAPSSTCGSRRLRRYRRSGGPAVLPALWLADVCGEAGGTLARRALLAASEPDGVSEADLGVPTRRGRNRGAETLAALQARGLLVAQTRGRKEVFALAHPALREIVQDFAIAERARATDRAPRADPPDRDRRAPARARALRRSPPPARHADRRPSGGGRAASLGGAAMRVSLGVAVAMLIVAGLYADSRRAYSLAFDPPDAGAAARVVVRLGRPRTAFLNFLPNRPPLGSVIADTGTPPAGSGRDTVARIATGPRFGDARRDAARARARLAARGAERPATRPARDREGAARRSGRRRGAEAGVQRSGGARRDPVGARRDRPGRRRRGRDPRGRAGRRRAGDPPPRRRGRRRHSPPSGGRDEGRPPGARDERRWRRAPGIDPRGDACARRWPIARRTCAPPCCRRRRRCRRATPPASSRSRCAIRIRRCAAAPRRRPRRSRRASRRRSSPRSPTCSRAATRARGARRWCCSSRSRPVRRPRRRPCSARVVLDERTPDDARVAALLILRRTGPPSPTLRPALEKAIRPESSPRLRAAALPLYARLISPAEAEEIARNEMKGPPAARASAGAPCGARVAADSSRRGVEAAQVDALRSVGRDAHRGGARLRVPRSATASSWSTRRSRIPAPKSSARRWIGARAGGGVSVPGRRHARPRAEDGAARRAAQPGRGAGAPRREPAGGGAAAARARGQGQRRRHAGGGGERLLRARQEERAPRRRPTCASPRATTTTTCAPRPPPVWPTSPPAIAKGAARIAAELAESPPAGGSRRRRRRARHGGPGGGRAGVADAAQADRRQRSAGALERGARVRQGRRQAGGQTLRRRRARAGRRAGAGRRRRAQVDRLRRREGGPVGPAAAGGARRRRGRPAGGGARGRARARALGLDIVRGAVDDRSQTVRAEAMRLLAGGGAAAARATCCRRSRRCCTARTRRRAIAAVAGIGELPDAGEAGVRLLGEALDPAQRGAARGGGARARPAGGARARRGSRPPWNARCATSPTTCAARRSPGWRSPGRSAWTRASSGRTLVGSDTDSIRRFVALEALVARAQRHDAPAADRAAARARAGSDRRHRPGARPPRRAHRQELHRRAPGARCTPSSNACSAARTPVRRVDALTRQPQIDAVAEVGVRRAAAADDLAAVAVVVGVELRERGLVEAVRAQRPGPGGRRPAHRAGSDRARGSAPRGRCSRGSGGSASMNAWARATSSGQPVRAAVVDDHDGAVLERVHQVSPRHGHVEGLVFAASSRSGCPTRAARSGSRSGEVHAM